MSPGLVVEYGALGAQVDDDELQEDGDDEDGEEPHQVGLEQTLALAVQEADPRGVDHEDGRQPGPAAETITEGNEDDHISKAGQ